MVEVWNVANLAIVMVVIAVSSQCIEAKDYTVGGDSIGWTSFPPGGASFYSKWASNLTFKVNDTLVFNFESGSHSVAILTKGNYKKCKVNNSIQTYAVGPARVTLNRTGNFYFSCTFSGHCSSGQKLSVKVKVTDPSPSPSPSPSHSPTSAESPSSTPSNKGISSPSSPTEPNTIDPPPKVSASPLSATLSLILPIIAFNFLMVQF